MEDIQDEIIGNLKETAYKTEQYHKDIFIIFIIILIVIFYYITIICVNYYENYIKAQVVKSKCGIDICEAETFRHMLLQHNNTDDYLKYIYILLVIFILWNLFSKKNMFDFDYLIIDTDTNTDTNTLKYIMKVFIIISIVLFILLIVRFVPTTKNENENENEKTLEILNNESMYSNYNFYNVTATYNDLVKIPDDNDIVKLYSWILKHDKNREYFKFNDTLKLPFKSLCEINKIKYKELTNSDFSKEKKLDPNTIYINEKIHQEENNKLNEPTEANFKEYYEFLEKLFTYIKNNGKINITEDEIRLTWNNDLTTEIINIDNDDFKFHEIGGKLQYFTINHIEEINKEENLVVKTSGFSMQSLKNNKFLNLVSEIILLIILFIIIIYIWNWIINKMKFFNENPTYKDIAIIIMDIMLLIGLFAIIGVKIKEYSENQSKNQGKCK